MHQISSTADQILACAQTLILAGGYNGFSYADIAAVVGISKPSIHHHFPSKAALVNALVTRYREGAHDGLVQVEQVHASPPAQLQAFVDFWKRCIADDSAPFCVCALLATQLTVLPDEVAVQVRGHFRTISGWLTAVLERGVEQGVIVLANTPRVEAEALLATAHGAMLSARAYGETGIFGIIMDPQIARLSAVSGK